MAIGTNPPASDAAPEESGGARAVALGPEAPRVRVTAGVGSAGQKTWNIRRPVTVIGSQRHAHIVLHHESVSKSHCAIINDGGAVVLRDLHSNAGTRCNEHAAELRVLNDGDVIQVGPSSIQVAITQSEVAGESLAGWAPTDALRQPTPLVVHIANGSERRVVTIEESAAVIGRSPAARISLDHEQISLAHALIFVLEGRPAVCDLASRTGLSVNGQPQTLAVLNHGDRLKIGPFEIAVALGREAGVPLTASQADRATSAPDVDGRVGAPASSGANLQPCQREPGGRPPRLDADSAAFAQHLAEANRRLDERRADLDALSESLAERQRHLDASASALDERRRRFDERSAQLDSRQINLEQRERRLRELEGLASVQGSPKYERASWAAPRTPA